MTRLSSHDPQHQRECKTTNRDVFILQREFVHFCLFFFSYLSQTPAMPCKRHPAELNSNFRGQHESLKYVFLGLFNNSHIQQLGGKKEKHCTYKQMSRHEGL